MKISITANQAHLIYMLLDSYIDGASETMENRNDLRTAKRIRARLLPLAHGSKR